MLVEILLISIWCAIAGVDMQNFYTHIHRPLVSGLVVGLILGDVQTGLIAGASIELAFLGLVPIAGSQPPNPVLAGVLGSAFAILLHQDPKTAVGIVLPFAVVMSILITFLYTSYAFLANRADRFADEGNIAAVNRQPWWGILGLATLYFLMCFLPLALGLGPATALISKIPKVVIDGLTIAGGLMPAIGFAILMNIMLRRPYIAYFAIGFVLAIYLKLPITAIAILGVSFAAIDYFVRKAAVADMIKNIGTVKIQSEDEEEGI